MMQLSMFQVVQKDPSINGLTYVPEYISRSEEENLIALIDQNSWNMELKRRVQHYGYKYDYKSRLIDASHYLGSIPGFIQEIGHRLLKAGFFDVMPDQVIVNEYLPGQGIAPHIDSQSCFSSTICSLSLASNCIMEFSNGAAKESLLLQACSLLVLQKDARYLWKHGIPIRKTDIYQYIEYKRARRISLTFRKVI